MKPYFEDDWVKIYLGDCRDILPSLPKVDLVLTSPPYNFDAGSGLGCKYDYAFKAKGYKDNYTTNEYYQQQCELLDLVIPKAGLVFYNIQMIAGNKDALFKLIGNYAHFLKEIIIWDKKNAEPAMNENCLNSQFEFILVFSKDNKRKFGRCFFERGTLSNVWSIGKVIKNQHNELGRTKHSAMMPVTLADRVLINFSCRGDTVLDPYLGSGTTALSAKKLNRKCIGIEIEEKYCEIAAKRCSQGVFDLKL